MKIQPIQYSQPGQTGIIENEPMAAYHKSGAIGCSNLTRFHNSPANYRHGTWKETGGMFLGTALHCRVFEHAEFDSRYGIAQDGLQWRSKADKEASIAALEQNLDKPLEQHAREMLLSMNKDEIIEYISWLPGKLTLTIDQFDSIVEQEQALRECDEAVALLYGGQGWQELTFRTGDLGQALRAQCRPDRIFIDGEGVPVVVDLKRIADINRIDNHMIDYGYYRIPEFYRQVVRRVTDWDGPIKHRFVFVDDRENIPPQVAITCTDEDEDRLIRKEIMKDFVDLALANKEQDWTDHAAKKPSVWCLPHWKRIELEGGAQ